MPAIPPELMLLPDWFPLNLYEMSSWTRGIVIPLALIYAQKPGWTLPEGVTVGRAIQANRARCRSRSRGTSRLSRGRTSFLAIDRSVKLYESLAVEAISQSRVGSRAKVDARNGWSAAKAWARFIPR